VTVFAANGEDRRASFSRKKISLEVLDEITERIQRYLLVQIP